MRARTVKWFWLALTWSVAAAPTFAANFYQGVTPASVPWPGGVVPYQFDPSVTAQQRQVYLDGMREWELAAKITFVPYTNQNNYVILRFDYGQGTNTYVAGNPAIMTIDSLSRAQICHETGHLLGFQHEHVRTNRDNYITIDFSNLQSGGSGEGPGGGGISNLYVIDSNSIAYGAYDFESVMHYGKDLFAADTNLDVIDPQPPYVAHYFYRIGNLCLSPLDRAGAAYLYGPPTTSLTNIVSTTADAGPGSLRAAIYYANDHPGTTVRFNIPNTDPGYSNGVYTIYLTGELPPLVANGTVIDATTQSGFAGKPVVAVDGSQVLPEAGGSSGVYFYESLCTLRGLAIKSVTGSPVQMLYNFCTSNHVEGCFLSLAADGTNAGPSGYESVNIAAGANGNVIGGTNASQRNVISGDSNSYGITVTGTNTANNVVEGNYIGTDATGTYAVPNLKSGVGIFGGAKNTVVGGTNAGAGNVLSGNTEYGVFVGDPDTAGTVIEGNFIGTDGTGNNAVPNTFGGIAVFNGVSGVTIGGTSAGARNVISGNTTEGVYILGTSNNVVQGNFVGLNAAGTAAVPNTFAGIYLLGGAQSNLVGGAQPGAGNVVSGNSSEGIYIANTNTGNNLVMGNRIGTDASGANAIPNGFTGVGIWDTAASNEIGGIAAGAGNLISGNGNGVAIGDTNTSGNVVQGNFIGTTMNGLAALGNSGSGVYIRNGASGNLVGGATAAGRNVISGNVSEGVLISDPGTTGSRIQGNDIGLGADGSTPVGNSGQGVVVENGAQGNFIGLDLTGAGVGNIIANNGAEGVIVYNTNTVGDTIRGNAIFNNGRLGINLVGGTEDFYGVTANHIGVASGPNDLQNYPVITAASVTGAGTAVTGTLNSTPNRNFLVDLYRNSVDDPSGHGQGHVYLGAASVTTDGSGNGTFLFSTSGNFAGQFIAATATDGPVGDTSEFSTSVAATNGPALFTFTGPYTRSGSGFAFNVSVETNLPYTIQASTNLAATNGWVVLTNFTAATALVPYLDAGATNLTLRFYRAVSP